MIRRNITLLFTCICFVAYGQTETDSLDKYTYILIHNNVNEYIYNYAYKNIAAFNIRHASLWYNNLNFDNRFRNNADFFYQDLMPDYGYKAKMGIEKIDSLYPNPRFHLYKIHIEYFDWIPGNPNRPEVSTHFIWTIPYFLIALNEQNGDIKFISGQFFTSYISSDFHINKSDPSTFIPYLTLRTFDVGGANIKFKKEKRKALIFEGYSTVYKGPLTISVNRKDFDNTQTVVKAK